MNNFTFFVLFFWVYMFIWKKGKERKFVGVIVLKVSFKHLCDELDFPYVF